MTEHDDATDGELVAVVNDPIRSAFGSALGEVMAMLPDGHVRRIAAEEILEAEARVRARLIRRVLN